MADRIEKARWDFCIECRKDTEYCLQKKTIKKKIRNIEYQFVITSAVCTECKGEMCIPGLINKNVQEIDEQYRETEGLISTEDIVKLMEIYRLGKAPLSLALGFGEITITRYLSGQVPSKEYSDRMKKALASPNYMMEQLIKNRDKIADAAYHKAVAAVQELENLFTVSPKMLMVIADLFNKLEEVTPLALQKLLYFIQGVYLALYGTPMFNEDCEAWIHGPVYVDVYNLFKDFKYNPIDDARFAIFDGKAGELSHSEKKVISLVANTFGMYGGKVLERITHNEDPWKKARTGYSDGIPAHSLLLKENMKKYYLGVHEGYGIEKEEGLRNYIQSML